MSIRKIDFNTTTFKPKITNNNKPIANLNDPIIDMYDFSHKQPKMSAKEATKIVENMRSKIGGSRFFSDEVQEFKEAYKKDKIDLDTINTFKDNTCFSMSDMKRVYAQKKYLKDDKFYDKVKNALAELKEQKAIAETFEFNEFEPDKKFAIGYKNYPTTSFEKVVNKYYPLGFHFQFDTEKGELQECTYRKLKESGGNYVLTVKSIDLKNDIVTTQHQKYDAKQSAFVLTKQWVETVNDNDETIREEIMKPSQIKGMYDIEVKYPDGKVEQIAKSTIDPKTGIKTIKKDMKSANGTRTQYLYEDDPKGNRLIDYKITDKNGKILMCNSQTFEVIDDNHFVSSKNGYKYDIKTTDRNITVKNLHTNKEASIDFSKKTTDKDEITQLLKKIPGEELFEIIDCVKNLNINEDGKNGSSYYDIRKKEINTGDSLMAFLHELGHAKDSQNVNSKGKGLNLFTDNEYVKKTYLKERSNFNEHHSEAEREIMDYFIKRVGHYLGAWGGLSEVVAETNALLNTYTDKKVENLGPRTHYLQQHFPETIAKINDLMNLKDDVNAIEYYGT